MAKLTKAQKEKLNAHLQNASFTKLLNNYLRENNLSGFEVKGITIQPRNTRRSEGLVL